jgi:hypothetical protein
MTPCVVSMSSTGSPSESLLIHGACRWRRHVGHHGLDLAREGHAGAGQFDGG